MLGRTQLAPITAPARREFALEEGIVA